MQKIDSLSGDDGEYYTIVANVKCLKRNVRLVVWYPEGLARVKSGGYRLYYSTDKDMSGEDTMAIYHARFQEEYLFRDGKQFTGLQDCQARSKRNGTLLTTPRSPQSIQQRWQWHVMTNTRVCL